MPKKYIAGMRRPYNHNRVFIGKSPNDISVDDHAEFEFKDILAYTLKQIPDPIDKIIFKLHTFQQLSTQQIASLLNRTKHRFGRYKSKKQLTREAVRVRLHNAIGKLRFRESDFF